MRVRVSRVKGRREVGCKGQELGAYWTSSLLAMGVEWGWVEEGKEEGWRVGWGGVVRREKGDGVGSGGGE